ncbi:MAG: hypothetical protein WC819_06805, partial [Parcubacteria group bacterium]
MNNLQKKVLAFVVVTCLFLSPPVSASAFGLDSLDFFSSDSIQDLLGDADSIDSLLGLSDLSGSGSGASSKLQSGIKEFLENDLNINVEESLKPITESINSAGNKGKIPEVSIRFSTPNPKPGEMVTALAEVTGISNENEAYYSWYIKNDENREVPPDGEDRMVTYRANAIRAQAEMYFDPLSLDQPMNGGNGDGSFEDDYNRILAIKNDNDDYRTKMGGDNGIRGVDHYCYVYDPETGVPYELSGSTEDSDDDDASEDGCPNGYTPRCLVENREIQCPTDVEGAFGDIITEIEDDLNATMDGTIGGNGGTRTETLTQCLDAGSAPTCGKSNTLICPPDDADTDITYSYGGTISIPTPFCVQKDEETGKLWTDPNTVGCVTDGASCSDYTTQGVLAIPSECDVKDLSGGDGDSCDGVSLASGDVDEKLYHLNPYTDRTTPLAKSDGALIAGIGLKEFTWKYQEGDEMGVVVEGMGLAPTKHEDATYQTVFAMMQPGCKDTLLHFDNYDETVKGRTINIQTASILSDNEGESDAMSGNIAMCVLNGDELFVKPGTSEYDSLTVSLSTGASQSGAAIPSGLGQPVHVTA